MGNPSFFSVYRVDVVGILASVSPLLVSSQRKKHEKTTANADCTYIPDEEKFYLNIHIRSPASTSFLTTGTTVKSESFHALLIELLQEKKTYIY